MTAPRQSFSCVRLGAQDNVAVVVNPGGLAEGDAASWDGMKSAVGARASIPHGHKVALARVAVGEPIRKFGCTIGIAFSPIEAGDHVHVHNVKMPTADETTGVIRRIPAIEHGATGSLPTTFEGYPRAGGEAGVRNYIVVVATVNCSASVTKAICRHFWGKDLAQGGIDGVIPVTDPAGCTQEVGGEYHALLNRTLAGWIYHPNVVGAVIIGLGCEGTTPTSVLKAVAARGKPAFPLEHFSVQESGGTALSIREGIRRVEGILERLPRFKREKLPVSKLSLALNCGGSDAFSALTANPALGYASDLLIERGGTVVLAEIPECHGAEELLYRRAESREVRDKLARVFAWWKSYATRAGLTLNSNLALGNIAGGITTIIEKSIGAVSKAGTSPLSDVVEYGEPVSRKGFVLMNTPGYDPVSVTGLVAGGCNMVAFTTGRGSVYGCAIAPTIKIATTSGLFARMRGDMDIDAGGVLKDRTVEQVGTEIYRFLLDAAGGKRTCSEDLGLGWEEFLPWAVGETL